MEIKYKIKEVADDFAMNTKDVIEAVGKFFPKPKSSSQNLSEEQLNVVFDYITQNHQIASLEEVFAAAKAKELAAVAKANISIYAEEDKVKKAEIELGKLYYRDYAVGEELDTAEYLPWCQKIDESKKLIAELKDFIASLREDEAPAETEAAPTDDDFEIVVADEPKADETPAVEAPKTEEAPAEEAPAEDAPKTEE